MGQLNRRNSALIFLDSGDSLLSLLQGNLEEVGEIINLLPKNLRKEGQELWNEHYLKISDLWSFKKGN